MISEISPLVHHKKLNIVWVHSYDKVLWLPGTGGWENGELFDEYSFTSTRWNVLELGCATMWIYLTLLKLEMVKIANFVRYILPECKSYFNVLNPLGVSWANNLLQNWVQRLPDSSRISNLLNQTCGLIKKEANIELHFESCWVLC